MPRGQSCARAATCGHGPLASTAGSRRGTFQDYVSGEGGRAVRSFPSDADRFTFLSLFERTPSHLPEALRYVALRTGLQGLALHAAFNVAVERGFQIDRGAGGAPGFVAVEEVHSHFDSTDYADFVADALEPSPGLPGGLGARRLSGASYKLSTTQSPNP